VREREREKERERERKRCKRVARRKTIHTLYGVPRERGHVGKVFISTRAVMSSSTEQNNRTMSAAQSCSSPPPNHAEASAHK